MTTDINTVYARLVAGEAEPPSYFTLDNLECLGFLQFISEQKDLMRDLDLTYDLLGDYLKQSITHFLNKDQLYQHFWTIEVGAFPPQDE